MTDIRQVGNPDTFKLLSLTQNENEGWTQVAKAIQMPDGCIVQVSHSVRNPDNSISEATACAYVPAAEIVPDDENGANKIVRMSR